MDDGWDRLLILNHALPLRLGADVDHFSNLFSENQRDRSRED